MDSVSDRDLKTNVRVEPAYGADSIFWNDRVGRFPIQFQRFLGVDYRKAPRPSASSSSHRSIRGPRRSGRDASLNVPSVDESPRAV